MPSAKENMLQFLQELPDGLSQEALEKRVLEQLEYQRRVRDLVARSRDDKEAGRVLSHEELGRRLGLLS